MSHEKQKKSLPQLQDLFQKIECDDQTRNREERLHSPMLLQVPPQQST